MTESTPDVIINAAWRLPELGKWDPNKDPTCRVTLRRKAGVSAGGVILPAGKLPNLPDAQTLYEVTFKAEFGTVKGAPAYQITGTYAGVTIVVAQGEMQQRLPH